MLQHPSESVEEAFDAHLVPSLRDWFIVFVQVEAKAILMSHVLRIVRSRYCHEHFTIPYDAY